MPVTAAIVAASLRASSVGGSSLGSRYPTSGAETAATGPFVFGRQSFAKAGLYRSSGSAALGLENRPLILILILYVTCLSISVYRTGGGTAVGRATLSEWGSLSAVTRARLRLSLALPLFAAGMHCGKSSRRCRQRTLSSARSGRTGLRQSTGY